MKHDRASKKKTEKKQHSELPAETVRTPNISWREKQNTANKEQPIRHTKNKGGRRKKNGHHHRQSEDSKSGSAWMIRTNAQDGIEKHNTQPVDHIQRDSHGTLQLG
jgi:hypothetical protein